MEDTSKLKISKTQPQVEETEIQDEKQIVGFYVILVLMDKVLGYIGQGPWLEVNDFITEIRSGIQPVYTKNQKNETENHSASNS